MGAQLQALLQQTENGNTASAAASGSGSTQSALQTLLQNLTTGSATAPGLGRVLNTAA